MRALTFFLCLQMGLAATAQTNIGTLGGASDAGQRVFDRQISVQPNTDPDAIYTMVDSMPMYAGGDEAFVRDLGSRLHFPEDAVEQGVQGSVVLDYVVEKDGHISTMRIVRGLSTSCDRAALDALRRMPPYTVPGKVKGQAVRVRKTIPVRFAVTR